MSTKLTDSDGDEVLVDQSQFTTWNCNLQLRARAKNYLGLLTGNEVVIQETPIPVRPTKPKTRAATDDGSYQELAEEYKLDIASYRLNHDRYEKYATRKRECVAWLYQKVHHAISGSVEETDDPKILYEAIQAQCKMTDSRALDHALNEYERTKLRFCSSMSDYLCKLEIARFDIRSLTSPSNITDTEFKSKIIRGLGNGYEDFVKHYQRVQDDPSVVNGTIKTLKSQLLSEEALVNAAKTKKDKDKDKDKNKGGRTSGSKKSGDKSDDDRKKLECCGRWGNHTEEECWVKHPEIKPDWAKEKEKNKDKDSNKDDKKKDFNKEKSAGHAGVVTGDETSFYKALKPSGWIGVAHGDDKVFQQLLKQASMYICNDVKWFTELHPLQFSMGTADSKAQLQIQGGGNVVLWLRDQDGDPFKLELKGVAFAPSSVCNLLSLSKLDASGLSGSWGNGAVRLLLESFCVGTAKSVKGLYHVQLTTVPEAKKHPEPVQELVAKIDFDTDPVWLWHRRLGHLSFSRMRKLLTISTGMDITDEQIRAKMGECKCPVCTSTRAIVRIPRDPANRRFSDAGDLLHIDMWGPYPITGWDGTKFFVFVTDDADRFTFSLRLSRPVEAHAEVIKLHKFVEKKYNITIRRYRGDRQFQEGDFKSFCDRHGITIEPTVHFAHHQVGVAERANRTIREGAAAMVQDNSVTGQIRRIITERGDELMRNTTLPEGVWPEAIDHAVRQKNRYPSRVTKFKETPWERREKRKPDLSLERIRGSRMMVSISKEKLKRTAPRKVHDARGWLGYFVGMEDESIYRVYNPDTHQVLRVVPGDVEENVGLEDDQPKPHLRQRLQRTLRSASDIENDSNTSSENSDASENIALMVKRTTVEVLDSDNEVSPEKRRKASSSTKDKDFQPDSKSESSSDHEDVASLARKDRRRTLRSRTKKVILETDSEPESESEYGPSPYFAKEGVSKALKTKSNLVETLNSASEPTTWRRINSKRQVFVQPETDAPSTLQEVDQSDGDEYRPTSTASPPTPEKTSPQHSGQVADDEFDLSDENKYFPDTTSALPRIRVQRTYTKHVGGATRRVSSTSQLDDETTQARMLPELDVIVTPAALSRPHRKKFRHPDSCYMCHKKDLPCSLAPGPYGGVHGKCSNCYHLSLACRSQADETQNPVKAGGKFKTRHADSCYYCYKKDRPCSLAPGPYGGVHGKCSNCRAVHARCQTQADGIRRQNVKDGLVRRCRGCETDRLLCDTNGQSICTRCTQLDRNACLLLNEDGTRGVRYLKEVKPRQERIFNDWNEDDPGCIGCKVEVYANHRFGLMCRDAVVEGVPCYPCMVRNLDNEKGQPGRCCRILSKDELQVEEIFCAYFKVVHDKDGAPKVVRNLAVPNNSVPINHYNVESNYYHGKKGKKSDKPLSSSDNEEFQEPDQPSAASRLNSFKFAGLATDALQATGVSMEDIENATSMVSFTIPSDASTRPVPQNFKEVQACPPDERRNWEQSDQAEIDSLRENKTFDLINKVPAGKRALSTRMVRRRKINSDGTPNKYKSRLVARGFQQKEGFDFTETYSGVVKTAAYRLLFALTAALGWTCHQMDFVTAFLNGELDEEVYIRFPDGLPGLSGRLAKLRKGLYGLKQAPRVWYTKLRVWLQQHDWTISQFDECVFFHKDRGLVMTVYVDDVNIFGANEEAVALCKKELSSAFKMTDEGQAAYYLGMQIEHSKEGIHIHQGTYIAQILERYGLADVTPVATPLDPSKVLVQSTGQASQAFITEYLSKVGSLNYLSSKTRADLACAISVVASFQTNPDQTHMDAVHHIFAYLKGCPRAGLFFRRNGSVQLQGFVDSDWAACKDTRRSRTGWLYQIAGAPISFASQRQKVVATSSTEAEYVAASDAAREAIWLRGFLNEIAFNLRETDIHQDAIRLHIDNASAVKLSKNPELHSRTKHIDIRHHFLRETVLRGEIQPEWISGKENPADLLTKQLPKFTFEKHFQGMGMEKDVAYPTADERGVD